MAVLVKHGGQKVFGVPLPLVALLIVENSRINLSISLLVRIIEKGKIQVVHLYCINADLLYQVKLRALTHKVITGLRL